MHKKISLTMITILILAVCTFPGGVSAQPVIQVEKNRMPLDTFNVNSSADLPDWIPGDGNCTDNTGGCTLRAAIEEANAWAGIDTITFAGPLYISLDTVLPDITGQLKIDASGAWNATSNQPGITINGSNQSVTGLDLFASGCEVYGLFLINFDTAILIRSDSNTIGGGAYGQRNVISSNKGYGVYIYGPNAYYNVVQGNWIGLSITGDSKQPNKTGVRISGGAFQNTIGGTAIGNGNVISGNTTNGVEILQVNTNGNMIFGNNIGQAAMGSQNVGNGGSGVYVSNGPQYTQVGYSAGSDYGNFIANNNSTGVTIWSANYNWIEMNNIILNSGDGITIKDSTGNIISSNVISQNTDNGVRVDGTTAVGNSILNLSTYDNDEKGIELVNGGNFELASPIIVDASPSGASGIGCAGCTVHVFSDYSDEGKYYEGFAYVDGFGHWSYSGSLTGPYVTATNIDANSNTSEYSFPGIVNPVYLPIIFK